MRFNRFKALTGLTFFLLIISGVQAQELEDFEDFVTIDEDSDIDVDSTVFDFDNSTRLVEYDFNTQNGTRLLFYSDITRTVEVYDVNGLRQSGVNELPIQSFRLQSGYTEILVDTTDLRGDRTLFMMVGDSYATISNDRTAEFIGTPETALGFTLGITGGGIAVILLVIATIKYKNRRIDKAGIRRR